MTIKKIHQKKDIDKQSDIVVKFIEPIAFLSNEARENGFEEVEIALDICMKMLYRRMDKMFLRN